MNDFAKSFDIRAVIFGTFYRCGFDLHELTPLEKQQIEIIQLYPYLKNGEIWRDIEEEFEDTNLLYFNIGDYLSGVDHGVAKRV